MATIANLNVILTAATAGFSKQMAAAEKSARQAGREFEKMYRDATVAADRQDREFEKLYRSAAAAADYRDRQNASLASGATQAGAALTAGLTLPIIGLGVAAVTMETRLEAARNGLSAVSGSSEATKTKLEELREVAKLPGLGFIEAIEGQTRLQAAGLSAGVATDALKAFGNAIATVGGGKEQLEGVNVALGQMAAKGKVMGQEINQLAERMPQIRQAMIAAFGTADTEVLQKMGLSAEEFVVKVSAELAKLPPVTGGLRNAFENLSDSSTIALARIGAVLAPLIERAVSLLEGLFSVVEKVAGWFAELPVPVQNVAIALAGVVAAIGPVLVVAGSLATTLTALGPAIAAITPVLGVSVGALAGWAAAIGVAVAALAALGVWVYDNWEPIKATLMQAWEGISEMWGAVWSNIVAGLTLMWEAVRPALEVIFGPLIQALMFIWDGLTAQWSMVWEAVTAALSMVWLGIKTTAEQVWGAVSKAIGWVIDVAAKIPGAQKLMSLDEAWASAKKYEAGANSAAAATGGVTAAAKSGETGAKNYAAALAAASTKSTKATKAQQAALKKLKEEQERAAKVAEFYNTKIQGLTSSQEDMEDQFDKMSMATLPAYIREITNSEKAWDETTKAIVELDSKQDLLSSDMREWTDVLLPNFVAEQQKTEDSFRALGITSNAEFGKMVSSAKTAYDNIVNAPGQFSQWEKDSAYLAYLKLQIQETQRAGGEIQAETLKTIADLETKLKDPSQGVAKLQGPFETFSKEVSTVITNLAQDLSKSLFDGEMSWGEKMKAALSSLGQAAVSMFVQPFLNALTGPEGLVTKGLNVVVDKLMDITGLTSSILGTTTNATSGVIQNLPSTGGDLGSLGIPGMGGGAAPAGGAAGGAASSGLSTVMSAVGAIGSVVSSVSSVVGNFQMAHMNTALGRIEEATRRVDIATTQNGDWNILRNTGFAREYLQYLVEDSRTGPDSTKSRLSSIDGTLGWMLAKIEAGGGILEWLGKIQDNTYWSLKKLETISAGAQSGSGSTINLSITIDGVTKTQTVNLNQQAAYNFS